jgi:3-methylcrotonyl-CoA carboxylase alpha subunit
VTALDLPPGVRVDTGIEAGTTVSPFYDSLLAKVVAHGRDRGEAIERLVAALDGARIEGVATNLDLLAAVLDEPAFRAGDLHTGFLEEHRVAERLGDVPPPAIAAVAGAHTLAPPASDGPRAGGRAWRLGGIAEPARLDAGGRTWEASCTRQPDGAVRVALDGAEYVVRALGTRPDGDLHLDVDGAEATVRPAVDGRVVETVTLDGRHHRIRSAPPPGTVVATGAGEIAGALTAPMPGRIVRVHVRAGDHVRANEPLLVLEAMKMEHVIAPTAPARVARLLVGEGEQVTRGQPLVELDDGEGDAAAEPPA